MPRMMVRWAKTKISSEGTLETMIEAKTADPEAVCWNCWSQTASTCMRSSGQTISGYMKLIQAPEKVWRATTARMGVLIAMVIVQKMRNSEAPSMTAAS